MARSGSSRSTSQLVDEAEPARSGRRGLLWPERSLWICAVDLDNGDLVVFGRDNVDTPIGVAVKASSSIPGFFWPVAYQGRRYVDGGVHSPNNADLAAGLGLDVVVVVSPMSATRASQSSTAPSGRTLHARRLGVEVKQLRASDTEVLTFQPTAADVSVMGRNAMDAMRREATTRRALESTPKRLLDPLISERLELLRGASSAS